MVIKGDFPYLFQLCSAAIASELSFPLQTQCHVTLEMYFQRKSILGRLQRLYIINEPYLFGEGLFMRGVKLNQEKKS